MLDVHQSQVAVEGSVRNHDLKKRLETSSQIKGDIICPIMIICTNSMIPRASYLYLSQATALIRDLSEI